MTTVLAVSGSLRRTSSNTQILHAIIAIAPGVTVTLFEGLGELPHFNPDIEQDEPSPPVAAWRAALQAADAVVICSPEYAHGVPGVLKNGLDWIVGSGELCDKPVGVVNASMRSTHAHASLVETLVTMSAKVTAVVCPLDGRKGMDAAAIAAHPELAPILRGVVDDLLKPT